MLSLKQGSELVGLARKAIETAFENKELDASIPKRYPKKRGVFVTLHMFPSNELRGCIGFIQQDLPLGKAVVAAARAAAFSDPRFMPLQQGELDKIIIEISILTEPEEIKGNGKRKGLIKEIEVGKDGLIVSFAGFSGLLLPQVPVEQGWEALEFLEYACLKAGLDRDAWKKQDCKIYKFQAQVFSESKLGGEVIEKKD